VAARAEIATCAISGAVGTFANVDPRIEEHVASKLGLAVEPVSTQVIPRDRHAVFFSTLAVVAASIENLATEIRHLQRTEVREAERFFSEGQKGSSAMPHKRNPVLTENLTGLARVVRSAVVPALENVTLWHERDISHSSAERYIAPDATATLDFALNRAASVVDQLVVYGERMKAISIQLGGACLLAARPAGLTQKGMSREDSYAAVQRKRMEAWRGNASFLALCRADKEIACSCPTTSLVALFDMAITPSTSTRSSSACSVDARERQAIFFTSLITCRCRLDQEAFARLRIVCSSVGLRRRRGRASGVDESWSPALRSRPSRPSRA
jgi:adenylosuccinate lyase